MSCEDAVTIDRRQLLAFLAAAGAGAVAGAGGTLTGGRPALAAPITVHPTTAWNAVPPSAPIEVLAQRPHKLFIHHTATPNSTDYSLEHGFRLARSIQRFHMQDRGWIDSGQQFTLTRGGHAIEGRHRSLEVLTAGRGHVVGAHCPAQNEDAVGIENEGTYSTVAMRAQHYTALVELSVLICTQFGIKAYQIYGHRDFRNTECPGDQLYAALPKLRADVAARIGGDPTHPVWPTVQRGDSGDRVRVLQYLLRSRGATIAVDGAFGAGTEDAVRVFQEAVTAAPDGIVGRQSWNHLAKQWARGASGEAVKAVQHQLGAREIPVGTVDGVFGANTEAGVRTFQRRVGLPVDGVVDQRTLSRLVG